MERVRKGEESATHPIVDGAFDKLIGATGHIRSKSLPGALKSQARIPYWEARASSGVAVSPASCTWRSQ